MPPPLGCASGGVKVALEMDDVPLSQGHWKAPHTATATALGGGSGFATYPVDDVRRAGSRIGDRSCGMGDRNRRGKTRGIGWERLKSPASYQTNAKLHSDTSCHWIVIASTAHKTGPARKQPGTTRLSQGSKGNVRNSSKQGGKGW